MALKTRQQLLEEEHARLNAMGGKVLEQTQNLPQVPVPSYRVGNQAVPGLIPGYAKTNDGQVVSQGQLNTGLHSAISQANIAAPDLTNQVQAAGQTAAPRPGQPQIQLGGAGGAPIGITNQQANAAIARSMMEQGGIRQVGPTGVFNVPFTKPLGTPEQQLAENKSWNDAQRERVVAGRTLEDRAGRIRQLEMDATNRGLASAAADREKEKMAVDYNKAVDTARIQKGIDPATGLPYENQPANPVKDENGAWVDQNTGKLITSEAVLKRLEAQERAKSDIEEARQLKPAGKPNAFTRLFGQKDNVWGKDPKTGKFREFGSQDELDRNKQYVPLSPEEQRAYEEGNKGLMGAAPAGGPIQLPTGPQATHRLPPQQPPPNVPGTPQYNARPAVRTNQYGNQQTSNVPSMGTQPITAQPAPVAPQAPGLWSAGSAPAPKVNFQQPAAMQQQGKPSFASHRASVVAERDPARKKAMILEAARRGELTRDEALALFKENGIQ
jgi:hypothetical protein